MTEFQDGFNRIAESGKKTFSSIVSKVRAKMQDFDQGQGWSWSQNPSDHPPQAASASYHPSNVPGQQQGSEQGAYTQPYRYTQPANPQRQTSQSRPARTSSYPSSPPRSGVLRPAATEPAQSASPQRPSYYDPTTRGYDLYGDDEDIQLNDRTTPSVTVAPQNTASPPHADGPATPPPDTSSPSPPSYTSPVSPPPNSVLPSTGPPARSLSPTIAGARATTPGTPGGVDFSKLGLLPKRPISLVPQSPPAAGASVSAPRMATADSESTADSSPDREEPEFLRNPFEDPR